MELSSLDYIYVVIGFFTVAVMYSSIGHAGASGYTAVLSLVNFNPVLMRPISLSLNIIVGLLALYRFQKAGLIQYKKIFPFVAGSIPLTFYAANLQIQKKYYFMFLGGVLLFSAFKLMVNSAVKRAPQDQVTDIKWYVALLIGSAIGCLSGLTGTGGAIFLTPLLLHFNWAQPRAAAGMSIFFVFVNSVSGLVGSYKVLPSVVSSNYLPWVLAVTAGAVIGTSLGIKKLSDTSLKRMLGLVLFIAGGKLLVLSLRG